jgi:acetylornithine deacetylase/succinyl-diaminopimelate desuccinylase-like protein
MRSIVDRFGDHPLAYIVLEGMALGQIYHRGLGVQRYLITVKTEGGHSWVDYGTPSAIHELADLATKLTAIKLPKEPRTSLNIGIISGGTSVNTIAAQASLELDLRSTGSNTLNNLILEIETLVAKSNKQNIDFQSEVIGQRPVGEIPENHPLVKLTADVLRERGIQPSLNIGSTDANIPLSLGLPCVSIGLTTGSGAHTINEHIQTKPLKSGMEQLTDLVTKGFDILK